MAELLNKCQVCGALLDEEDLFCVNCGVESPDHADESKRATLQSTHNFKCEGCGASMSYDASAQNLRCPFCGSERLASEQDVKVLAPEAVAPFTIGKDDAMRLLKQFMGGGFFRPSDLAEASVVTKMTPIYVPYWVFSANATTHWTADTSQTPPGARASWFPISGDHSARYENVLVGASGALTPAETSAICPFDLAHAVPPHEVDLENALYEPFRVQRKYARPQAIRGFDELEREACRRLVPGNARNVHVAVRLTGLVSHPVLLPLWIMAYQYRGATYRFLVNGQTGKHTGGAPFSMAKLAMVVGIVLLALLLAFCVFVVCAGVMSRT